MKVKPQLRHQRLLMKHMRKQTRDKSECHTSSKVNSKTL